MLDSHRYACSGELSILGDNEIEITELPIRVWTQVYKESVMESVLHGSDKQPALINDYKEYHTDTTVRFVVNVSENKLEKAEQEGLDPFLLFFLNFHTLLSESRCHFCHLKKLSLLDKF